jgi:hypothetical protein
VVPESLHDFFGASARVAGALIGLLFVAISVASDRLARQEADAQMHRVRAAGALTAFLNALTVSLFALIPGQKVGPASLTVAIIGLVFVIAALLSLIRSGHLRQHTYHDLLFLLGLVVVFGLQLLNGISLIARPHVSGTVYNISELVIVCFLIGIARSWELIGGPSVGLRHEVSALLRDRSDHAGGEAGEGTGPPPASE